MSGGLEAIVGRRGCYLSPHSDDAAYSSAGVIALGVDRGQSFDVVTVFSRSRYTKADDHGDADATTATRMDEDRAWGATFGGGVRMAWLGLLDAPLRGARAMSTLCAGGPLSDGDLATAREVVEAARPFVARTEIVMLPLAFGRHVDHEIVRLAGLALAAERQIPAFFYEDLPYAGHAEIAAAPRASAALSELLGRRLTPLLVEFDGLADVKRRALERYPSQTDASVERAILGHAERVGRGAPAERLWRLAW